MTPTLQQQQLGFREFMTPAGGCVASITKCFPSLSSLHSRRVRGVRLPRLFQGPGTQARGDSAAGCRLDTGG